MTEKTKLQARQLWATFCALALAVVVSSGLFAAAASSCSSSPAAEQTGLSLLSVLPDVLSLAQRICTPGEPYESCLAKCQACAHDQANDAGAPVAPVGSVSLK